MGTEPMDQWMDGWMAVICSVLCAETVRVSE